MFVSYPRRKVSEFRYRRWVSPFGNPRIKASSQLPVAYRSVARPSSPLSAKASAECPYRHLIALIINAHPARQQDGHTFGQSFVLLSACAEKHDRKTSFASQDRTDSSSLRLDLTSPKAHEAKTKAPLTNCHAASRRLPCGKPTNDDAPGCRLPQAVAATHVHARMIAHARTPGTIPSSRCQTTRTRSIDRPVRISVLMDEFPDDWWSQSGSNRRPHACKARALPAELWPL